MNDLTTSAELLLICLRGVTMVSSLFDGDESYTETRSVESGGTSACRLLFGGWPRSADARPQAEMTEPVRSQLTANRVARNSWIWTILDSGPVNSQFAATVPDGPGPPRSGMAFTWSLLGSWPIAAGTAYQTASPPRRKPEAHSHVQRPRRQPGDPPAASPSDPRPHYTPADSRATPGR